MSRSLTTDLPAERLPSQTAAERLPNETAVERIPSETRLNMRRVLRAFLFGQGWGVLVSGACWICFAQEMGLKESRFAWGLLAAIPWFATLLQLAGSYCVERSGRRKPSFFLGFLTSRWTWAAMAAMPLLLTHHPTAAIACVLLLFLLHQAGNAFAMPSWTSWMADVIPSRTRGRFFGLRAQIGPFVVVPLALLAGWLLNAASTHRFVYPIGIAYSWPWEWPTDSAPFPVTTLQLCSLFFAAAAVFGTFDILTFRKIRDENDGPPKHLPSLKHLLVEPLKNRSFRRFLTFNAVLWLAVPGIGNYVWLYVMNPEGVGTGPLRAQAIFFGAGQLGAILFCGLWGRFIDRFGRKTALMISCGIPCLLPMLYGTIQPGFWWLGFLVAFIDMATWTAVDQSNFNGLLHYSSGENGSSYQAVYAVALAITGSISGIFFGWLAEFVNGWTWNVYGLHLTYFHVLFAVATVIRLGVCATLLPRLDNDSAYSVREAVRYVFGEARGFAVATVTFPWRALAGSRPAAYEEKVEAPNK